MVQPWIVVFLVSTVLQILPLFLLFHFGGITLSANRQKQQQQERIQQDNIDNSKKKKSNSNKEKKKSTETAADVTAKSRNGGGPTFRESLIVLRREATTPEFWLHLTSRSCLMVFASFLLFVPTLMNQVYGCSNAVAAQVASAYSLGCLLSVSFGSRFFASLSSSSLSSSSSFTKSSSSSSWKQITAIIILLSLATAASSVQLLHAMGRASVSWTMSTLSMFVWGFAFSLPFYLPSSLYALARGGRECSASIADCFDFVGFTLLACFNKFVASIDHHTDPSSWIGCFRITTACSVLAMITQSLAVFLEKRKNVTNTQAANTTSI